MRFGMSLFSNCLFHLSALAIGVAFPLPFCLTSAIPMKGNPNPVNRCQSMKTAAAKTTIFLLLLLVSICGPCPDARAEPYPAPDPPWVRSVVARPQLTRQDLRAAASLPTLEWTYHKTADSAHPDGSEQQMLWLINRARANPTAEGIWLAETDEPSIVSARAYFNVDLQLLKSEFAALPAKPPAAFDLRLYTAAQVHCQDLIARDKQDHTNQIQRISDAGFSYTTARGVVFSYAEGAIHAHGGFNIDWGDDGGDGSGMQPGRGHRTAIMSSDGDYANVGIAVVSESDPGTDVGPLVVTGNFCAANTQAADHYNRFIVGTVWEDRNQNETYDPGEGLGGVQVMPDRGTYFAVTGAAGGYAIPAAADTDYRLTFSGGGLAGAVQKSVAVNADSALADFIVGVDDLNPADLDADGGYDVSAGLWVKAVLEVPGSPVTLVWKAVGTDITPSGDQVISGYFYADPNDFAYGSLYNPELFVKIYIATSGWCNIAFNHVTVDDVTVSSAHQYVGSPDQTGTARLADRLVEHKYSGVVIESAASTGKTASPSR